MGFPSSYPDMEPPGPLLLPFFILLVSLRSFLSLALHLIGLGDLVADDPAPTWTTSWSEHIARHHLDDDGGGGADPVRLTRCRPRPAPAAAVRELIPAGTYAAGGEEGPAEGGSCTVCLCELRRGEEVRRPRGCPHVFHRRCLDPWVDLGRRRCPLCRAPLVPACDGPAGAADTPGGRDRYDYAMEDDDGSADLDGLGLYFLSDPSDMPSSLSLFLLDPPSHAVGAHPRVAE